MDYGSGIEVNDLIGEIYETCLLRFRLTRRLSERGLVASAITAYVLQDLIRELDHQRQQLDQPNSSGFAHVWQTVRLYS